jgi:hypothetical protein
MKSLKQIALFLALAFPASCIFGATYQVSSIADLRTRINSAVAGDVIVMANGVYTATSSIGISRVGTAANPITIRAAIIGGVELTGTSGYGFSANSGAAHVHIQGFKFTHQSGRNSINNGATFIRFTRNVFECTGDGNYLVISGHDAQVDYNEFRNKSTVGNMIDVRGSGSQIARRVWIHHNYFHDFTSAGENGAETIRFGLSGLSLSTGNGLIEHNFFIRCRGENEMISNKSSGNTYRYNTVLDSAGAEISQRHGNDCLYYGNYMRNTAGIRVYGDRHLIFSNYLESNTIGVNMGNGDGDVYNGAALTAHDRPDDNVVVFNTFVNNNTHYQMGGRSGGLGSTNTTVANNIFQGGGSMASISSSGPYTGSWTGNIRWQTSSAGNMPSSGYTNINPQLVRDANQIYHLQAGSPAIDTAVGSYPFVTVDQDGQPRDANPDKGADEFSNAPIVARILSAEDVGPSAGLTVQTSAPSFNPPGGQFASAQQVTITTATAGATIRYTTDGSDPSRTNGTVYAGPVTLASSATLKAIAYKDGETDSAITSDSYVIGRFFFEAEALTRTSTPGVATAPNNDVNNSGGVWIALNATAAGQWVEYTLPDIPAGAYRLAMKYKQHTDRGVLSLAVNGTTLGSQLNQYSTTTAYPEVAFGVVTLATSGNQIVRLTSVGPGGSGSYKLSSDTFTLDPVPLPTITAIADQSVPVNTATGAISFTIGGGENPPGAMTLEKESSNTALVPLSGIVFGGSGANRTVTVTPAPNKFGEAEITVSVNDAGAIATRTFSVSVTATPSQAWRITHFGSAANTGNAADTADPDSDGVVNLLEFALDGDPNVAHVSVLPVSAREGGEFVLTYSRRKDAIEELTFLVEAADGPGGTWSPDEVVQEIVVGDGSIETVKARVEINDAKQKYLRLRVTRK